MLDGCHHRGPDSTDVALQGDALEGELCLRFFVGEREGAGQSIARIRSGLAKHGAHIVEDQRVGSSYRVQASLDGNIQKLAHDIEHAAKVILIGSSLKIVKDMGSAYEVDDHFGVSDSKQPKAGGDGDESAHDGDDADSLNPQGPIDVGAQCGKVRFRGDAFARVTVDIDDCAGLRVVEAGIAKPIGGGECVEGTGVHGEGPASRRCPAATGAAAGVMMVNPSMFRWPFERTIRTARHTYLRSNSFFPVGLVGWPSSTPRSFLVAPPRRSLGRDAHWPASRRIRARARLRG